MPKKPVPGLAGVLLGSALAFGGASTGAADTAAPVTAGIMVQEDGAGLEVWSEVDVTVSGSYVSRLTVKKTGAAGSVTSKQEYEIEPSVSGVVSGNRIYLSAAEGDVVEVGLTVESDETTVDQVFRKIVVGSD